MKIKSWTGSVPEEIEEYTLCKSDTPDEVASALGRLLDTLAKKGLLTAPEVVFIVEDYETRMAEFITETNPENSSCNSPKQ